MAYQSTFTSDGCPVVYTRLSALNVTELAAFPRSEFVHFVSLWYERSLQLFGESTCASGTPCKGTCDVYDCSGVRSWSKLMYDLRKHRATVSALFDLAAHTPDGLWKAYIINAPSLASVVWNRLVRPFLSERAQSKVAVCAGVPAELADAIGGEERVRTMIESVKPRS